VVNKPKRDGTDAETKVQRWLISKGYPYAKKLRQEGAFDIGDVHMGDGYPVCIEVKGGQGAVKAISSHVNQTVAEIANSHAETGVAIVKKARSATVDDWYAVMPASVWLDLIKQIYPPPADYDAERASGQHVVRRGIRIRDRQRVDPDPQ
jgi:hypothetical protein